MREGSDGGADVQPTAVQPTVSPELSRKVRLILSQAEPVTYRSTLDIAPFLPSGIPGEPEFVESPTIGAATAFDFKAAMELLRTFFEEFLEDAARKVADRSPATS